MPVWPGLGGGCETDAVTATDSWDMPLRTRLLARALGRTRGAIHDLTLDDIVRSRAQFAPARAPFTWVTGSVPASVAIDGTGFTARDGVTIPVRTYRPLDVAAAAEGPLPATHVRFMVLHEGRACFEGTAEELRASTDAYLRHFLFMTLPPW